MALLQLLKPFTKLWFFHRKIQCTSTVFLKDEIHLTKNPKLPKKKHELEEHLQSLTTRIAPEKVPFRAHIGSQIVIFQGTLPFFFQTFRNPKPTFLPHKNLVSSIFF